VVVSQNKYRSEDKKSMVQGNCIVDDVVKAVKSRRAKSVIGDLQGNPLENL